MAEMRGIEGLRASISALVAYQIETDGAVMKEFRTCMSSLLGTAPSRIRECAALLTARYPELWSSISKAVDSTVDDELAKVNKSVQAAQFFLWVLLVACLFYLLCVADTRPSARRPRYRPAPVLPDDPDWMCAICMEGDTGGRVHYWHCTHAFHKKCVAKWVRKRANYVYANGPTKCVLCQSD